MQKFKYIQQNMENVEFQNLTNEKTFNPNQFKISQNLIKIKIQHNWLINYKLHVNTKFSKYLICIDNHLKVEKN